MLSCSLGATKQSIRELVLTCSFRGVIAIDLPTVFEGFLLSESSHEEAAELNIQIGSGSMTAKKIFSIRGSNFTGYIVASAVFWHEDEGSHFDESFFKTSFAPTDAQFLSNTLG
jgi:hypothetical protein